jgi:hypothetical protein
MTAIGALATSAVSRLVDRLGHREPSFDDTTVNDADAPIPAVRLTRSRGLAGNYGNSALPTHPQFVGKRTRNLRYITRLPGGFLGRAAWRGLRGEHDPVGTT